MFLSTFNKHSHFINGEHLEVCGVLSVVCQCVWYLPSNKQGVNIWYTFPCKKDNIEVNKRTEEHAAWWERQPLQTFNVKMIWVCIGHESLGFICQGFMIKSFSASNAIEVIEFSLWSSNIFLEMAFWKTLTQQKHVFLKQCHFSVDLP